MNTTLEETLEKLIRHADPMGENYERLKHYLKLVRNKVMLGPHARGYIHKLHEMLNEIECEHLAHDGKCRKLRGKQCPYATGGYEQCQHYERARPATKHHELLEQLNRGDSDGDLG